MPAELNQRYTEAKVDATIVFAKDEPGPFKPIGNPHPALIHLVEFRFDDEFVAWFGVADIACDALQVTQEATAAGMKPVPEGWARDLMDFRMQITLADGRRGATTITTSRGVFSDSEYHRVEFTGLSKLSVPTKGK